MAKRANSIISSDFTEVADFFQSRGITPKPCPRHVTDHARKLHKVTYGIVFWKFKLARLPTNSRVFIDEMASDAIQIMPQVLSGYIKPANLLVRGIIENGLRHFYFHDHPIEFARLHSPKRWYISVEELFEYINTHPGFQDVRAKVDAPATLRSVYSELSESVHGRTINHLQLKSALSSIAFDLALSEKLLGDLIRAAEALNLLMATFHHRQFVRLSREERIIVLGTLSRKAKQALKGL